MKRPKGDEPYKRRDIAKRLSQIPRAEIEKYLLKDIDLSATGQEGGSATSGAASASMAAAASVGLPGGSAPRGAGLPGPDAADKKDVFTTINLSLAPDGSNFMNGVPPQPRSS